MAKFAALIVAATLLSLLLVALIGIQVLGCKADPPSRSETAIMNWIKHRLLVRGKDDKNPLNDSVADGKEAFSHYCVACHGLDGQNTGVPCSVIHGRATEMDHRLRHLAFGHAGIERHVKQG
jgi:cytochrome c553